MSKNYYFSLWLSGFISLSATLVFAQARNPFMTFACVAKDGRIYNQGSQAPSGPCAYGDRIISRKAPFLPQDIYLEITYRQKTDGQLSDSVHYVQFECDFNNCTLTTLTLNQCLSLSYGPRSIPKIEANNTKKSLKVKFIQEGEIDAEERILDPFSGEAIMMYKFKYTKSNGFYGPARLIDFSGGVLKDSSVLNKTFSWEMSPLRSESRHVQVKPTCDMELPGLSEPGHLTLEDIEEYHLRKLQKTSPEDFNNPKKKLEERQRTPPQ